MTSRPVLFSGIQPTGELHLGNYLGAIRNWVQLAHEHESWFCIVDYHAITIPYEVQRMAALTFEAAAMNMACGIGPGVAQLFVQSAVPEHTELAWVLASVTPMGELERMTQYKDKARDKGLSVNAGLFGYPLLQTADIALYQATVVPVGEDQRQHLELAREIIRHFNRRFGETFPEPEMRVSVVPKVLGLDGEKKMSKSLGNTIPLAADRAQIEALLRPAKTDVRRQRRSDPGEPEDCNIFSFHKSFTPEAERQEIAAGCRSAGIGCMDCKLKLVRHIDAELAPIRERYAHFRARPREVHDFLNDSARAARARAGETMARVRERLGLMGRPS